MIILTLSFISTAVPRMLFDGWTGEDYLHLFSSEDEIEDCIETILKFIKVCPTYSQTGLSCLLLIM